ncbi:hypothetical protein N7541_003406 [Penicillium brevicompactum]|uniref:Protein kinase domain-containing protein n=1 Tax=Penicillium brevicompactum TaxID=5074 RepID=A0A9W9UYW0_PENBR|nr:hypothetical protein N7541_003406 [Penicillium brevicompactum]
MANTEASNADATDFGDFVKNEEEELDLEEVEPWHRYATEEAQNVLYSISVGEVLNERYLVEHKLGFGGGSTVWMAFDLQEKTNVALKVMAVGKWGDNETEIQDEIIKTVQHTSRLVLYTTTFSLLRDDGSPHRVLVLPMKGSSICTLTLKKTPMASHMSAAQKSLETVASLHEAGILHRDLNARNCMRGLAPIKSPSRSAKYELSGRPMKQIIPFVNLWKRGDLVSPVKVPEDFRTDEFYLYDFGDMAIFSMLYLNFPPFPTDLQGGVVSGMVECLGPPPEQWKGHFTHPGRLDKWYDQTQTADPENDLAAKLAYFRSDIDIVERQLVQSRM